MTFVTQLRCIHHCLWQLMSYHYYYYNQIVSIIALNSLLEWASIFTSLDWVTHSPDQGSSLQNMSQLLLKKSYNAIVIKSVDSYVVLSQLVLRRHVNIAISMPCLTIWVFIFNLCLKTDLQCNSWLSNHWFLTTEIMP